MTIPDPAAEFFVHPTAVVDEGRRDRPRHEDLALLPHHAGRGAGPRLQPGTERDDRVGREARTQRKDTEQRFGSTRASCARTTCSSAPRACSPTCATRAAPCRAGRNTSPPWCGAVRPSVRTPRSYAAPRSANTPSSARGAVVTKPCAAPTPWSWARPHDASAG